MSLSISFNIFSIPFFSQVDQAPTVFAAGRQAFCPGNPVNIVTDFSITDPDDTTIDVFYIQISEGYEQGFDTLQLDVSLHPNILPVWDPSAGKLTLRGIGSQMLLTDLENAVKDSIEIKKQELDGRTKAFKEKLQKLMYKDQGKKDLSNEKQFDGRQSAFKEKLKKLLFVW